MCLDNVTTVLPLDCDAIDEAGTTLDFPKSFSFRLTLHTLLCSSLRGLSEVLLPIDLLLFLDLGTVSSNQAVASLV